jgi:tRNA-intron endonuclease, archaea type
MARAAAVGRVEGEEVLVPGIPGERLHARHQVGEQGPAGLRLSLVEAAWCVAGGRLETPLDLAGLLSLGTARAEVSYLVYSDLRSRGLVVRHDGPLLAVRSRQGTEPAYRVVAAADTDAVRPDELTRWAAEGLVVGVADEDGSVTHYAFAAERPEGAWFPTQLPPAAGSVLADRVLVTDPAGQEWWRRERVGQPHGDFLVLSFTEAEWLRRRGVLQVPELAPAASAVQPHCRRTIPVYETLRGAGCVPRSGFKFGTHLRAYRGDPDAEHAQWLVDCVAPGEALAWSHLSRAVRVAHGVRKRLLVAVAEHGQTGFVGISWFRP